MSPTLFFTTGQTPLLAESVNTPSLEPRGRLLISKLPFPRCDFQHYEGLKTANSSSCKPFFRICLSDDLTRKQKRYQDEKNLKKALFIVIIVLIKRLQIMQPLKILA